MVVISGSPVDAAELHDTLVLLEGGKRWVLPGTARVQASLLANVDEMPAPGDESQVTQTQEATGEIEVDLVMTEAAEWDQYQHVLGRLRRGTQDGPAVFTSAHPEIAGRRIKRLFFVSEQAQPYSAGTGYRTKLKFREKQKQKAPVASADGGGYSGLAGYDTTGGGAGGPNVTTSTAAGQKVYEATVRTLSGPPAPADGGRASTATPGYCSASIRVAGTAGGLPPSLYGASANATEGNFKRANLSEPWGPDSMKNLQLGDHVFWGNDPSGFGHVGIVVGRDKDGMPLIAGNNLVTYRQKGGRFDAGGRPIDRHIDARGTVRLDQLSSPRSQPTSVGKPGGVPRTTKPRIQGPAAPLPNGRPSQNVPPPPAR